ncbi:MAG TPA: NAD(P)-binding domain-containing protein [Solirubrobacteraceae bacterium]|jgi:cation diffusion facilitator CzcD-associated flavoprotein CzcO
MRDEVCVIGAGGAGLAAGCALAQRGIPFRVLEARGGIGGMWRHGQTFAYDSLTSNTSRYRTSFRAHRMSWRGRPFVHHTEFLAYLESFADRFGLRERVETGARVVRAEPDGDGWSVTVEGREPEPFRAVIVATGLLARPRRRATPGDFSGRRLHAGEYRSPHDFEGQDVVVTGMGTSGLDIAIELIGHARSVTLAVRNGMHVAPRHLFPRVPFDLLDTRSGARLWPFAARRAAVGLLTARVRRAVQRGGLPAPAHRVFDEPIATSDGLPRALRDRRLGVRPGIERFDGDRVVFADGSALRADAVIEATGYEPDLGFLGDLAAGYGYRYMPLYRGVAHPSARGLFFVGLVVGQGALLPVFEAQARWAAAVLDGALPWPAPEQLERDLAEERRQNQREFGAPFTIWRDRLRYVMWLEREVARARAVRGPASAARAS